jgi:hypothetical protein
MNLLLDALYCKHEMMRISKSEKTAIIRLTVSCSTARNVVTWDLCIPKIKEMQQPPVTK